MGPKQSREHIGLKYNKKSHGRSSSEPNLTGVVAQTPPAPVVTGVIRITVKEIGTSTSSLNRLDSGINSQKRDTGVATLDYVNLAGEVAQTPPAPVVTGLTRKAVKEIGTSTSSLNQLDSGINSQERETGVVNVDHVNIDTLTEGENVAVGMWSYESRNPGEDISIAKGTQMIILDDTSSELWTKVRLLPEEGWVQKNYIQNKNSWKSKNSLMSEEWFMDVDKQEGLEIIRNPQNSIGSFLIRAREDSRTDYILVMKTEKHEVRQFIIHWDTSLKVYYITLREKFERIGELVDHYRGAPVHTDACLTEVGVRAAAPIAGLSLSVDDKYELDRCDIRRTKLIGKGTFGQVFRGLWHNKVPVAIKVMDKDTMNKSEFRGEAQAMKDLVHPRLVKLHGFVTNQEPNLIVTELVKRGDLLKVLRDESTAGDLNSVVFFNMAYQIVDGMTYLAGKNLIHGDLAARNILVTDDMSVKIADFGMARIIKDDAYNANKKTKFPVRWMAPEALEFRKCTEKSEVWSYGIVVYEIYSRGAVPYADCDDILDMLKKGKRCRKPDECPEYVFKIMKKCWEYSREDRPTFAEVKNYFNTVDEEHYQYYMA